MPSSRRKQREIVQKRCEMTTILTAGSQTLAQGLAATSQMSARPQFELSFSLLQNSLLDRLSDKIDKLNDSSGVDKVDAFIEMQRKQLIRALPPIGKFGNVTHFTQTSCHHLQKHILDRVNPILPRLLLLSIKIYTYACCTTWQFHHMAWFNSS